MAHLIGGEPAPWFSAPSHSTPRFAFSSVAGRYVLLGFAPADPAARAAMLAELDTRRALLRDTHVAAFIVLGDPEAFAAAREAPGLRWFLDADGEIARLYGAAGGAGEGDAAGRPAWFLIDPSLRILLVRRLDQTGEVLAALDALASPDDHAGVPLHAPVLIVPRIFEPKLCRRLIDLYDADGGTPSGVMRERDGKTIGVLDDFKKRRDASIGDLALQRELNVRITRRLLPEIAKAFQFKVTRLERYIVACYDAGDGGYFRPHRDNTTPGTAHRQFAVSINLNAEEFEGGDLRFPEFGRRTYRPPTGGAVVFSCSLLHEATPVTRGRRYAFLPFLYDEAAATVRERNRHTLLPDPPPLDEEAATGAEAPAPEFAQG